MFGIVRFVGKTVMVLTLAVVLLIAGVVALFVYMDSAAKVVVEHGTTQALGVQSRTERVNVALLRQRVGIDVMTVANPEGYSGERLMDAERMDVHVVGRTLLSDVVEVPLIEIEGLTLHAEQRDGRNNFAVVLDHMQQRQPEEPRRRYKVDRVVIRDITANVQVLEQLGRWSTVRVHIPEIVLDDVVREDGGVAVAELTRRIVPVVVAAVIEEGQDIPNQVSTLLAGNIEELVRAAGDDLGRLIEDVGGELGRAVEDLLRDGLENLFRRRDGDE